MDKPTFASFRPTGQDIFADSGRPFYVGPHPRQSRQSPARDHNPLGIGEYIPPPVVWD